MTPPTQTEIALQSLRTFIQAQLGDPPLPMFDGSGASLIEAPDNPGLYLIGT